MSLPEPLRFNVGLIDQISAPLGHIIRQFDEMGQGYRDGTQTMITGAAGVAGAGLALQSALMPAIEMERALGEVKALGVADETLTALSKTALTFSAQYGQSAVEVIRHAEGVKNAMGDMPAEVMASVTQSSATLSMAMKSDAETVNRYLKNLHGNYQQQAKAMGNDAWTAQVAGMTAEAKRLYGVEMSAIEAMVDGMHSLPSTLGVSLQEQLAVLSTLNTQMSDGDAVTQYTNFLENAAAAQDKLGVSLTDSAGQLLPMQQVLKNIAPLIQGLSGTEARTLLDGAGLGDGSLMLINLVENMDQFTAGMDALGKVNGLGPASDMAATMSNNWDRVEQGLFAVRAAIGSALMPTLLPLVGGLADGAQELVSWTQLFPNLTKYIGFAGVALFGAAAAGGVMTMMMGFGKQAMVTYMLATKAFVLVNTLLTKGMAGLRIVVLAANLAIAANPIVLVVGAVVAAVAAIGALVYYWDDLKTSFGDTTWFKVLEGAITLITLPFQLAFQLVRGGWQWVMSGFTDTSGFDGLFALVDRLRDLFGGVFGWITEQLGGVWEAAKGVMDWLPGFGGDEVEVTSAAVRQATPKVAVPPGGAAKSIANYTGGASTHYGGVNIYPQQLNSPQDLAFELEVAAG